MAFEDSRLRPENRSRKETLGRLGYMERVYCLNCGTPGGLVKNARFVVYLCSACERFGRLPLPEMPLSEIDETR